MLARSFRKKLLPIQAEQICEEHGFNLNDLLDQLGENEFLDLFETNSRKSLFLVLFGTSNYGIRGIIDAVRLKAEFNQYFLDDMDLSGRFGEQSPNLELLEFYAVLKWSEAEEEFFLWDSLSKGESMAFSDHVLDLGTARLIALNGTKDSSEEAR